MGIIPKIKECKGYGREPHKAYLFSRGYCKNCNTASKLNEKRSKRTKTQISRFPTKRQKSSKSKELAAGEAFWKASGKGSMVFCTETGDPLGIKYNHNCLCHTWSKGSAKEYQSDPRNFIILKYELHQVLDSIGTAEYKRKMLPKTYDWIIDRKTLLKREYHEKLNINQEIDVFGQKRFLIDVIYKADQLFYKFKDEIVKFYP